MTRNQKIIIISVGSALLGAYLSVFIYQRIQRAKADANVISEDKALEILEEKSSTPIPYFNDEDVIPILPNEEVVDNIYSQELRDFEISTGYGDY
jgi:flagellar biosynthesis/type III secretory pathway M-ring protein FliF/YscJ